MARRAGDPTRITEMMREYRNNRCLMLVNLLFLYPIEDANGCSKNHCGYVCVYTIPPSFWFDENCDENGLVRFGKKYK